MTFRDKKGEEQAQTLFFWGVEDDFEANVIKLKGT